MSMFRLRKKRHNPPLKRLASPGFPGGLNKLGHPSSLKRTELQELINGVYSQYGTISKRLGSKAIGGTTGNSISQLYAAYDVGGNNYLIRISDTGVPEYYDFSTGNWTNLTGVNVPSGSNPSFSGNVPHFNTTVRTWIVQLHGNLFFANSEDDLVWFDGTDWHRYSYLPDPTGYATVTKQGSGTGYTNYYYRFVYYNETGHTAASPAVTTQSSGTGWIQNMPATLDSNTYIKVQIPTPPSGTTKIGIYRGNSAGDEGYLDEVSVDTLTYEDKGQKEPTYVFIPPTSNTTKGYHFYLLDSYRGSLVGVTKEMGRDTIVWSGAEEKYSSFALPDGAGYLAYRKGEGSHIQAIKPFVASNEDSLFIFKDNAIGKFQFVDTGTSSAGAVIRDVNIAVGSLSPLSPHVAGNDLRFWSREGAAVIGNAANYGTILRYSVMGVKIEAITQQISHADLDKVAGVYYKHLTMFGVSLSGGKNDAIVVYDERYDAWSLWTGEYPAIFAKFVDDTNQEKLYYGSSIDGKVVEMFNGKTQYDGKPITLSITTKQYDAGFPDRFKRFDKVIFVFSALSGNNTSAMATLADHNGVQNTNRYRIPTNITYDGFGVDQWGTILVGETTEGSLGNNTPVRYMNLKQKDLYWVSVNLMNDGLLDEVSLLGIYIYYSDSSRPLPYTSKLTEVYDVSS